MVLTRFAAFVKALELPAFVQTSSPSVSRIFVCLAQTCLADLSSLFVSMIIFLLTSLSQKALVFWL